MPITAVIGRGIGYIQVISSSQCFQRETDNHTITLTSSLESPKTPNIHVFRLWEKTRSRRGNPQRHMENRQKGPANHEHSKTSKLIIT